jgi:hypothetical protein
MAYTTIDKSDDYFNTKLYTGDGGANAITGIGFPTRFGLVKARTEAKSHLFDSVRGTGLKRFKSKYYRCRC